MQTLCVARLKLTPRVCCESLFLVIGHPTYYPRVGFQSDLAVSVESPWGKNAAFMARGTSIPAGRLVLPKSIAAAH
jgi:hypothetical protein